MADGAAAADDDELDDPSTALVFSSTPSPRHRGHEFRPVVSHSSMHSLWKTCLHLVSWRHSFSFSYSQRQMRHRSSLPVMQSTGEFSLPHVNRPPADSKSSLAATGSFAGPSNEDKRVISSYVGSSVKRLGVVRIGWFSGYDPPST